MALNANALTTLNMAKRYCKVPLATLTDDDLFELFINSASQDIESYCDRTLKSQSYTEYQDGKGHNVIVLRQWPVTAISSVHVDSDSEFSDPATLIPADDYEITDEGNSLLKVGSFWPRGYRNIKVVYTAGFSTVPSDLEHAALWLVAWYYNLRKGDDIGRTSKSKEGETVSYLQSMPDNVRDTLDKYKRTEFFSSSAGSAST